MRHPSFAVGGSGAGFLTTVERAKRNSTPPAILKNGHRTGGEAPADLSNGGKSHALPADLMMSAPKHHQLPNVAPEPGKPVSPPIKDSVGVLSVWR